MRQQKIETSRCPLDALSQILSACGFNARLWKGSRIYLSGYGKDIKAYLQEGALRGPLPADGYELTISSTWRMPQYNGLRCKGVKHAMLEDLFAARLISAPPPARWQDVDIHAPLAVRPKVKVYCDARDAQDIADADNLPDRHPRDPYAALRALHQKTTNA